MKKLGIVRVCGIPYTVIQGSWKDEAELKDNYGLCDPKNTTIWIRDGQCPEQFKNTLFHEMMHALCIESGARTVLGENAESTEEALIQILTPHMLTAMESVALWKGKKR